MEEKLLGAMENKSTYSQKMRKSSNEGYVLVFINPQYTGKELSNLLNEEIPPEKIRHTFTKLFHNTFRNTEIVIKATDSLPTAEELLSNPASKFLFKDLATKAIGTVLEVLQSGLGLEIRAHVSADKDQIFVKVKATEDGLKVQADIIDYKLQFTADAAGLGNCTDLKDFQEVLPYAPFEKNTGKIPAPGFHKTVSNSENLYQRFNYQGAPTENGETLFRPVDKIRLIRSMILSSVNLTRLTKKKILCSEFALPNEYDLFQLQQSWANFRLFYKFQPFHLIRNYFGEEITLYFSWLEFYLKWLFTPAIIGGILATTYYVLREMNHAKEYSGACLILFSFLIAISSSFIDQIWIRTEKTLAWKWGVTDYERSEEQRAYFRGKSIKDEVSGKIKKVSHRTKFELFARILGYIVMILFMVAVVSITYAITVFRNTSDFAWREQAAGAINVVGIKTLNFVFFI